jgi:hypothetical protein
MYAVSTDADTTPVARPLLCQATTLVLSQPVRALWEWCDPAPPGVMAMLMLRDLGVSGNRWRGAICRTGIGDEHARSGFVLNQLDR